jgi:hypothetical protein
MGGYWFIEVGVYRHLVIQAGTCHAPLTEKESLLKVWIAGIALVGALASGVVQADGNSLLKQCQAAVRFMNNANDSTNDFGQGKCLGIVEAVIATTVIRNEQMPRV